MGFLTVTSLIFGWVYFFCWSASFYPQPLLNWRRGSTAGSTVDFPFLNVLGFAAYLASNVALYYSSVVRAQYAARHNGLTPTAQLNDIAFALHATVLSAISLSQYLAAPVWKFDRVPGARPSRFIIGVFLGCLTGVLVTYFIVASATASSNHNPATDWCELDVVYAISYVKLIVTLIKFAPQLIINWRNRSTKGWSINQINLDIVGGFLSVGQQGIDSWLQRDWSGITGNPVKFALGNVSIFYDTLFIIQHYFLYSDVDKTSRGKAIAREEERLLPNDEPRTRE